MFLDRRSVLTGSLAALAAGCAPGGGTALAIADAKIVLAGVAQSWSAIKAIYPTMITPAADARISTLLTQIPGVLDGLSKASDAAGQATGFRQVLAITNGVLTTAAAALAGVPGVPPEITLGLQAVTILLPIIEAAANALLPVAGARPAAGPLVVFESNMTPDQARAILNVRTAS